MTKSSKEDIDKDIKKLIYELETNSNRNVFDIGNKLGFSRVKTWRLIKDLENNNTIWGYTAIVDDSKISRKRFYILIKRMPLPTPEEKIDSMVKRDLRKEATKIGVHYVSSCLVNGLYDSLICITADDVKQVKRFTDSLNRLYGANISEIHILEVLFPVGSGGIDNPNIEKLREYL